MNNFEINRNDDLGVVLFIMSVNMKYSKKEIARYLSVLGEIEHIDLISYPKNKQKQYNNVYIHYKPKTFNIESCIRRNDLSKSCEIRFHLLYKDLFNNKLIYFNHRKKYYWTIQISHSYNQRLSIINPENQEKFFSNTSCTYFSIETFFKIKERKMLECVFKKLKNNYIHKLSKEYVDCLINITIHKIVQKKKNEKKNCTIQ